MKNEKDDVLKVRWSNKYSIRFFVTGVSFGFMSMAGDALGANRRVLALIFAAAFFVCGFLSRGQPLLTISNNQVNGHGMVGPFKQTFKIGSLEELEIRDGSLFLLRGDEKKKLASASRANPEDWKRLEEKLQSIRLKG